MTPRKHLHLALESGASPASFRDKQSIQLYTMEEIDIPSATVPVQGTPYNHNKPLISEP